MSLIGSSEASSCLLELQIIDSKLKEFEKKIILGQDVSELPTVFSSAATILSKIFSADPAEYDEDMKVFALRTHASFCRLLQSIKKVPRIHAACKDACDSSLQVGFLV